MWNWFFVDLLKSFQTKRWSLHLLLNLLGDFLRGTDGVLIVVRTHLLLDLLVDGCLQVLWLCRPPHFYWRLSLFADWRREVALILGLGKFLTCGFYHSVLFLFINYEFLELSHLIKGTWCFKSLIVLMPGLPPRFTFYSGGNYSIKLYSIIHLIK